MRVFFLVLVPTGLAPYPEHIFKQASQVRKEAKVPSPLPQAPAQRAGQSLPPTEPWGPNGHQSPARAPG